MLPRTLQAGFSPAGESPPISYPKHQFGVRAFLTGDGPLYKGGVNVWDFLDMCEKVFS